MGGGNEPGLPDATTTASAVCGVGPSAEAGPTPGLVLAWTAGAAPTVDRAAVAGELAVGRADDTGWTIPDPLLSRRHFAISWTGAEFLVVDLGSRNGTFVDGRRVAGSCRAGPGAVIRAGSCVFVTTGDLGRLAAPNAQDLYGITGRFHAGDLVHRLRLAARAGRHVLLEGETGTGKELAAAAIHTLLRELGRRGPLVAQNAARFAGEQDAVSSLFGVARGAFTGVQPRPGALELAADGTLFLDELHALPLQVQRSLLRFAEDGRLQRVGDTSGRPVDVRLICATNVPVEQAVARRELAHDLVARLHRVRVAPLRERRADIPEIFRDLLRRSASPEMFAELTAALDAGIVESLCRGDYRRGNVRELVEAVAVAIARRAEGESPRHALQLALPAPIAAPPVESAPPRPALGRETTSPYEMHRDLIVQAYRESGGRLTALERTLRDRGLRFNRKWLAIFLDRWGVRPRSRAGHAPGD